MNQLERNQVAKILVAMSEIYSKQLSQGSLTLMLDHLTDLEGQKVLDALNKYVKDPTSRSFPLPGQIRAMISPEPTDQENAVESVNRIIQAMSRFGWTNPDKAKEFIGDLGWLVVQREGGWQRVCETSTDDQLPILKAQWRMLATALVSRSKAGLIDQPPALPRPVTPMLEDKS